MSDIHRRRRRRHLPLIGFCLVFAIGACGSDDGSEKAEQNLRAVFAVGEHTRVIAADCAEGKCRVKVGVPNPFYKKGNLEQLSDKNAECYQKAEDPMLDCIETSTRVTGAQADRWLEVRTVIATYNDEGKIVRIQDRITGA